MLKIPDIPRSMAVDSLTVPDGVSFEQAIVLTQSLLEQLEQGKLSDAALADTVSALVSSENGARGFFVTYLSDDRPLADTPVPAVLQALGTVPEVVAPLLVKNLAMSTAMGITHRQNQHEEMALGSDRVRSRTAQLIQMLPSAPLQHHAQALARTIDTGTGDYQRFLERWGYNLEQQHAIRDRLEQTGLLQ